MLREGQELLKAEGYLDPPVLVSSVDMRYVGQNYEISLPIDQHRLVDDVLCASFDNEHERLYGFRNRAELHEIVRLRTTVIGPSREREMVMDILCPRSGNSQPEVTEPCTRGERSIYGESGDTREEACIYRRCDLEPGQAFLGPALVEEESSATLVPGGASAEIDTFGNIVIDLSQ